MPYIYIYKYIYIYMYIQSYTITHLIWSLKGAKVTMLVRGGASDALQRIGVDRDIAAKLLEVLRTDGAHIVYSNVDRFLIKC